jgi:recombination protein RecT
MNAPSNLPAERREVAPIEVLKTQLSRRADEFKMVLPAHITPEKFQRVVATAAIQNPQLLQCDRQSFLLASMKLAQDGLIPDGREAALVPFKTRVKGDDGQYYDKWLVQPMPMVYGLRKKILQSGEVLSIETGVVYLADLESGHFLYEVGLEPPLRYRPNLLLSLEETADDKIVAAYSIAKLKNETGGDPYWSVEVMRRAEIDKVRQSSQTGAVGKTVVFGKDKGKPIPPKGPWVDWYSEMARKTVLRRHAKVLPMSGDILETFERDIESERAAESAAAFLAVEERQPVTLPSAAELDGEVIDHETGEILTTDERGMTEVDEQTARELDAQSGHNGGEDEHPAWAEWVDKIKGGIRAAKNATYLESVEKEYAAQCASLPKEPADEVEGLLAAKKRELGVAA